MRASFHLPLHQFRHPKQPTNDRRHYPQHFDCSLFSFVSGGRSIAGFPAKNPSGFSVNPVVSHGITGKSSTLGTWHTPNACHTTSLCPSTLRPFPTHSGSPSPPFPCGVNSPAGYRSAASHGVTHRFASAKLPFRFTAQDARSVSSVGCAGPRVKGTSLYATGFPVMGLVLPSALAIFHVRARVASQVRTASCSVRSTVSTALNALP
mmetsp:Transcript_22578/g.56040  ORF Transcript_22578/g.56040 Transcript_22578/m.56040 type:complete len:207 (-) Transcript_22578:266-886(-)